MRSASLLAIILAIGCASRPPIEEPKIRRVPPALIAESGASLYVIEARDDLLDDNSKFFQREPGEKDDPPIGPKPSSNTRSIGEQSLEWVLRYSLSQKADVATFIGHADVQPRSGWPMEVTLFNPDAEVHAGSPKGAKVGFHVRFTASSTKHPAYASVEWEAEKLTDNPGPRNEPGKLLRVRERIAGGSCTLPWRASLVMHHRSAEGGMYLLLLRITSLEE